LERSYVTTATSILRRRLTFGEKEKSQNATKRFFAEDAKVRPHQSQPFSQKNLSIDKKQSTPQKEKVSLSVYQTPILFLP
jgi:hypothetical protein